MHFEKIVPFFCYRNMRP